MDQIQVRTELLSHQAPQVLKKGKGDAWFYDHVRGMLWCPCLSLTSSTGCFPTNAPCEPHHIFPMFPASCPRAEWPREANIPTYIPKFRNGWEPPIEIFRGAPWEIDIGHLQEEVSPMLPTIPSSFHPPSPLLSSPLFRVRGICPACSYFLWPLELAPGEPSSTAGRAKLSGTSGSFLQFWSDFSVWPWGLPWCVTNSHLKIRLDLVTPVKYRKKIRPDSSPSFLFDAAFPFPGNTDTTFTFPAIISQRISLP